MTLEEKWAAGSVSLCSALAHEEAYTQGRAAPSDRTQNHAASVNLCWRKRDEGSERAKERQSPPGRLAPYALSRWKAGQHTAPGSPSSVGSDCSLPFTASSWASSPGCSAQEVLPEDGIAASLPAHQVQPGLQKQRASDRIWATSEPPSASPHACAVSPIRPWRFDPCFVHSLILSLSMRFHASLWSAGHLSPPSLEVTFLGQLGGDSHSRLFQRQSLCGQTPCKFLIPAPCTHFQRELRLASLSPST